MEFVLYEGQVMDLLTRNTWPVLLKGSTNFVSTDDLYFFAAILFFRYGKMPIFESTLFITCDV
jgi:hypothetical protein